MSHWSKRKPESFNARTLSLPIFFSSISKEDQQYEINKSLENSIKTLSNGVITINWSCLQVKKVSSDLLVRAVRSQQSLNYGVDIKVILNVEGNLIEELPEDVFDLEEVVGVFARSNRIARIPQSIYKLKALKTLTLANNPIQYLPIEVTELPLANFTITEGSFITREEAEARNRGGGFRECSLVDLCVKKNRNSSYLSVIPEAMASRSRRCSFCRKMCMVYQLHYKYRVFKEVNIPFEYVNCGCAAAEE